MDTIKLTELEKNALIEKYSQYSSDNLGEYIVFRAATDAFQITIYTNSKGDSFKATVICDDILAFMEENNIPVTSLKAKKEKKEDPLEYLCKDTQIGSDEVGFGDFFGPLVVVAAYVNATTLRLINDLGINDSKKISDKKILEIVPKLLDKVSYSLVNVSNESLNNAFDQGFNLNQIKSIMHNKALNNIYKKHPRVNNFFIDEFTSSENYYRYIAFEKNDIPAITFRTHGESAYPSVALASCIARYTFLNEIKKLSEKYEMDIPFGASKKVDEFAKEFVDKYGIDELKTVVKTKFKNYKNLLDNI